MEEKDKALSPSAKAFLVLMASVKEKTPLEIMREFNEKINQEKMEKDNGIGRETSLPDGGTGNKTGAPIKNPDEFKEALVYLKAKEYVRKLKAQEKNKSDGTATIDPLKTTVKTSLKYPYACTLRTYMPLVMVS